MLSKVTYEKSTIITAENMNEIQDAIIDLQQNYIYSEFVEPAQVHIYISPSRVAAEKFTAMQRLPDLYQTAACMSGYNLLMSTNMSDDFDADCPVEMQPVLTGIGSLQKGIYKFFAVVHPRCTTSTYNNAYLKIKAKIFYWKDYGN